MAERLSGISIPPPVDVLDKKSLSVQVRMELEVDRNMHRRDIEMYFSGFAHSQKGAELVERWTNGDPNSVFGVATLTSVIGIPDLPDYLKPAFSEYRQTASQVSVAPYHDVWTNCDDSEVRLGIAARQQIYAGIYDTNADDRHLMVLKGIGRLTALCTETFTTPEGKAFIEGNWYSPTDRSHRQQYNAGLDQGIARFGFAGSDWALMRAYKGEGIDVFKQLRFPQVFDSRDELARRSLRAMHTDEYVNR